ncbi:hypothetical protein [Liquorilactobacillus satsumensis]|uniref:hypothetical protein n=1 Tax=Liquorilactobacillus satsumensis TaxID=259059 RepID=UPI0039EA2DAD
MVEQKICKVVVGSIKKFFKKNWRMLSLILIGVFIILVLIPVILEIGITNIPGNGDDGGWLGFWGGYLGTMIGSAIAIGGVYWQVQKNVEFEKKLSKTQIESEKELAFRSRRPFCIVSYNQKKIYRKQLFYFGSIDDKEFYDFNNMLQDLSCNAEPAKSPLLNINNVSEHRMMAVKVTVGYSDESEETFCIEKIDGEKEINIITKVFTSKQLKKCSKQSCELKSVTIYFTSEQREKIKLVFNICDQNVKYQKEKRKIENHEDVFEESEYSLENFKENPGTLL